MTTKDKWQLKVGDELTVDHVVKTVHGTPAGYRMYAPDVHGPEAMARAAWDLIAGKPIAFARCTREGSDSPVIIEVRRFQVPSGLLVVRVSGRNNNPLGPESETLYGTGSIDTAGHFSDGDAALIAAALCWCLLRGDAWVYRIL